MATSRKKVGNLMQHTTGDRSRCRRTRRLLSHWKEITSLSEVTIESERFCYSDACFERRTAFGYGDKSPTPQIVITSSLTSREFLIGSNHTVFVESSDRRLVGW